MDWQELKAKKEYELTLKNVDERAKVQYLADVMEKRLYKKCLKQRPDTTKFYPLRQLLPIYSRPFYLTYSPRLFLLIEMELRHRLKSNGISALSGRWGRFSFGVVVVTLP